jgi:hypothetical protein
MQVVQVMPAQAWRALLVVFQVTNGLVALGICWGLTAQQETPQQAPSVGEAAVWVERVTLDTRARAASVV